MAKAVGGLEIAGRVSDGSSRGGLSGFTVTATAGGMLLGTATTRGSGRYRLHLSGPVPGGFFVSVREPPGEPSDSPAAERLVATPPAAQAIRLDFVLPGLGTPRSARRRSLALVGGEPVDRDAVGLLTPDEVAEVAAGRLRGVPGVGSGASRRAADAFPGIFVQQAPSQQSLCGERHLRPLRAFLRALNTPPALQALDRIDAQDFPGGEALWKRHRTRRVEVAYTTDVAEHALPAERRALPVPPAGATELPYQEDLGPGGPVTLGQLSVSKGFLDAQAGPPGVDEVAPEVIQQIALVAERTLDSARSFGLRDPPRFGEPRLRIRVCGMPGVRGRTTPSWDRVEISRDNTAEQNLSTVPHEIFHRVQYAYNPTDTVEPLYGSVREGGARFAEDCFNDHPNRYVVNGRQLLMDPTRSILSCDDAAAGSACAGHSYATGLLWKYFAEQHGTVAQEPQIGVDAYRVLVEQTATVNPPGPVVIGYDPAALSPARARLPGPGTFEDFVYRDPARTELVSSETTWGNFLVANAVHGGAGPAPDPRLRYREDADPVEWGWPRLGQTRAQVFPDDEVLLDGNRVSFEAGTAAMPVRPYSARYYRVRPAPGATQRLLRIALTAAEGMTDPLLQIVLLGAGGEVADLVRLDRATCERVVSLRDMKEVLVLVGARRTGGTYRLVLEEVWDVPLVSSTRWNTMVGRHYETDPATVPWRWTSPDLVVDADGDDSQDPQVVLGRKNRLRLRLRNHGDTAAAGIGVEFWCQPAAAPNADPTAWIPVTDAAGKTQVATVPSLSSEEERWVGVTWVPPDDGSHSPSWCVKARLTVPGDPNTDDKVVLGRFDAIVPP